MVITPWEVKGEVDYEKIIREFGAEPFTEEVLSLLRSPPPLFSRGLVISHRDLDKILADYENGVPITILTGRGPSGPVHIGHLLPFLLALYFQREYGAHVIIPFSEDEKYAYKHGLRVRDANRYKYENARDILALGFDPKKTKIFFDFDFPEIYRLAFILGKRITYSTARAVFGLTGEHNLSFTFYPAVQVAHILLPHFLMDTNVIVPVAIDQDPHIRLSRDVAERVGKRKPGAVHTRFLPSITGSEKMSASEPESAIWITDTEEEVRRKVWRAFTGGRATVKEQREKGGEPEKCVVFAWLKYVFEEDEERLRERERRCRAGEIMCGECKEYLAKKISEFLKPIQKRREKIEIEDFLLREEIKIPEDL